MIFIWIWPIVCLGQVLNTVLATRSAPDIGLCVTVVNRSTLLLDCLTGYKNFCCNTEQVETWNNVTRWAKKCCSEAEFVVENS